MTFLVIGLVFAALAFVATRRVLATVAAGVLTAFLAYLYTPTLAWGFPDLAPLLLLTLMTVFLEEVVVWRAGRRPRWAGPLVLAGIGVVGLGVAAAMTWTAAHAQRYQSLIGEVKEASYAVDTSPVDPSQVRTVDEPLASRLADKLLGEDPALGSRVRVGAMHIQQVNGRLFWVAPLDHSGLFKWFKFRAQGTPGYIMVSATDDRDTRMVRQLGGEPVHLVFNGGNWFGTNLRRYLYDHGYSRQGLTDYTFEVDDSGRPYYVVTRYAKRVGFGGEDATGVVVVDAQTGAISDYDTADAPTWIDRIQPEPFVRAQLTLWGRLVHGWWNPSDMDEVMPTTGTALVYGDDGRSYWYTGMTSVGSDEGTIGFTLVDTRTKEARLYHQAGATEEAASGSAEGAVQNAGYRAGFPIPYNVAGQPAFFVILKDNKGLAKAYAWVSQENYQVVGVGETVADAMRQYRRRLTSRGNVVAADLDMDLDSATARVLRMSADTRRGETTYYLVLEGLEDRVFAGASDLSIELPLTGVGDEVSVRYDDAAGRSVVDLVGFDNRGLTFRSSAAEKAVEKYRRQVGADSSSPAAGAPQGGA